MVELALVVGISLAVVLGVVYVIVNRAYDSLIDEDEHEDPYWTDWRKL